MPQSSWEDGIESDVVKLLSTFPQGTVTPQCWYEKKIFKKDQEKDIF